jgi:hypothetical protein
MNRIPNIERKLKNSYATAIISLVFAVTGFSYNTWRMEASEDNNNIRTAAFEVLKELAEMQQLIFAAHYDNDPLGGNPRVGWVKVELIGDLSTLVGEQVQKNAKALQQSWENNWQTMTDDRQAADELIAAIDKVRMATRDSIAGLE